MREPVRDKERLLHIIDAIDTILERSVGLSFEELTSDKLLFGGIVYYTMIIGEASYKLSHAFVNQHPDVQWQTIADMRHHIVHGYYQVDAGIVWDVIHHDLIPLRAQVEAFLLNTDWEEWERTRTNH